MNEPPLALWMPSAHRYHYSFIINVMKIISSDNPQAVSCRLHGVAPCFAGNLQ